ncbi:MAG TPA: NAD(P)H-hydrate dehydratase [Bacteriovoracaceae bacterium]|nr:NAD(P)H-hydrate dehydratase [Bacteriovoracaceae bacterium]
MRIVTQTEMKELEKLAQTKFHFPEKLIIENVALLAAKAIVEKLGEEIHFGEIIFLIGKGNNGGTGLAIARHLASMGFEPRAFLLFDESSHSVEVREQMTIARAYGVRTTYIDEMVGLETYFQQNNSPKIIVDAIFGTGVRLPLSNFIYDVIHFINQEKAFSISLDIPTGVEGDSGLIQGNAIRADMTLAVALPKLGYYQGDGPYFVGEVKIIPSGLPVELIEQGGDKFLVDQNLKNDLPPARNKFGDKKLFGHTLIIGGSHGLTGALVMTSTAALKVGAGLVTAATWEPQYQEFISRLIPEIMTGYVPLDQAKWGRLIKSLHKYDSVVIGPGLARSNRARMLVLEILNNFGGPVVLDADAINVLSLKEDAEVFRLRNAPTLLTPHLGEFSRFTGIPYEEVVKSPYHHLKDVIEVINCPVILKGPCTYLGFPNGKTYFNFSPNDGMATGGVGDVLAGILGGLIGQEANLKKRDSLYNIYENLNRTILLGVLIHTWAGKYSAERLGVRPMTATSLIEAFPEAFKALDELLKDNE